LEAFGIRLPAIDPAAYEDMFFINRQDLEEIAQATRYLGPEGQALVEFARRYQRAD